MIKIDANLASRPFVNHRKFYLISGGLLVLLLGISYWNFARYQSARARRGDVNGQLIRDRARFEALGREQEKVLARLQTLETAEFLDTLEHVNQLIRRRTFSWTRLLNDLERLTPANLQIVTIKPQIAGKGIIIEIVANGRSSQDNVQFVSNLESSGKFYDVSPLHEEISKNPAFVGREIAVQVKYKGQS
jgi:type IV pilus assembly protein PilN